MKTLRTGTGRRPLRKRHLLLAQSLLVVLATATAAFSADTTVTVDRKGAVGEYASIAIDANGLPVVSYYDGSTGDLKILRCLNRTNCRGKNSVVAVDTAGDVGRDSSLALDIAGNPVVSYHDRSAGDLKVLHCNDANCSGGDESISLADDNGVAGTYASLALDTWGNPVVAYNGDSYLRIMHCNDADCAGGDESITTPDPAVNQGFYNSLRLDAGDFPVVAYRDTAAQTLKVLHCNDVDCAGGDDSIETPDSSGSVGSYPSLVLRNGLPAVAYLDDANRTLKVLRCNDANCSGGDETISSPIRRGTVGREPALGLDGFGSPIVAHQSAGSKNNLVILACDDPYCL